MLNEEKVVETGTAVGVTVSAALKILIIRRIPLWQEIPVF